MRMAPVCRATGPAGDSATRYSPVSAPTGAKLSIASSPKKRSEPVPAFPRRTCWTKRATAVTSFFPSLNVSKRLPPMPAGDATTISPSALIRQMRTRSGGLEAAPMRRPDPRCPSKRAERAARCTGAACIQGADRPSAARSEREPGAQSIRWPPPWRRQSPSRGRRFCGGERDAA